ncbi:MAG: FemAB family PEP-CTERM system-associated protein [bacterium]|nr:FemAB family PEP-CTERM system-associated protein [bacterium]
MSASASQSAGDGPRPHVSVVVVFTTSDVSAHPQAIVEQIGRALDHAGHTHEFVFVLDGPVGRVEHELREISGDRPIEVVQLQGGGLGESIALSAGVERARGDYILNLPAYLQMEPEDTSKVITALEAGADCVATWRVARVDPWLNQLQSRLFNFALRLIMKTSFHDLNSGTRGFRRQVLEEVSVYGELYRFLPVLASRQGFRTVEVKVRHREEKGRAGFYGIGVYLRRLLDILAITFLARFTQRPLRFFGYLGFTAAVMGTLMATWPLYLKIFENESLTNRPLFVIGAILAAFGVQLIGFGLIGEIIIFTQAPNLRGYKIEEIVEGLAESAPRHLDVPIVERPRSGGQSSDSVAGSPATGSPAIGAADAPGPVAEDGDAAGHGVGGGGAAARGSSESSSAVATAAVAVSGASLAATSNGDAHAIVAVPAEAPPLRVREILPGEDARWDAFVSRHPQGTFFHLTGWSRVAQQTFRHAPHHLVVEQGREWLGVLPLFQVNSLFLGRNFISTPYAVYGGVLAEHETAQAALLEHAGALGKESGAGYVELRHLEERPGERPQSPLYVTYRRDLPDDPEQVLPSLPKKARAECRYAIKAGVEIRPDCSVDQLYELFTINKRRLGSPALPKRWFDALVAEFGKAVVIHRAVDAQERTLAAVMSFCFKDTVYAYYSGAVDLANDKGVNNYIYCGIMEWAASKGYARFDFGRSRADSGPAKFKKHMGFTAEPLHYEYLLVGDGAKLPEFHPGNPRLALPRRVWSRMPMFLTNRLGGRLSRYLP